MTSFDVEEFVMTGIEELKGGFVVGVLQNPAGNREVDELMEIDRLMRREGALLRSSPAVDLISAEQEALNDRNWSLCIVAVDLASGRYIGYMSVHRIVTRGRGTKVEIEEVVTHPEFEGRGVGKATMAVALQEGRGRWGAQKATLTSRANRAAARGLYAVFGFEEQGEGPFVLRFGDGYWRPPKAAHPRLLSGVGREDDGSFWHMGREMRSAVSQICAGTRASMAPWTIIEPTGVYKYKDAP